MKYIYLFAGLLAGCVIGYFSCSHQYSTTTEIVASPVASVREVTNAHDAEPPSDTIAVSEAAVTRDRDLEELIGEVERRLRAIESNHAAAVGSSEDTKQLMKAVEQAHDEFAIEAKAAAQKHEEFRKVVQSYDPIWISREPQEFVDMVTKILEEVSNENSKLKAELADEDK